LQKALDHGALFVELDYLIYLSRVEVNDVKPAAVSCHEDTGWFASSILVKMVAHTAIIEDSSTRGVIQSNELTGQEVIFKLEKANILCSAADETRRNCFIETEIGQVQVAQLSA